MQEEEPEVQEEEPQVEQVTPEVEEEVVSVYLSAEEDAKDSAEQ